MGCRRRNMQPAIKKTQCLSDPIITDLLNITIFLIKLMRLQLSPWTIAGPLFKVMTALAANRS